MDSNRDAVFLTPLVDGIDFLPDAPGVYVIFNRLNGRRYVGQAETSIYQRCLQHRSELKRGRSSNFLLRRDAAVHGADTFFFLAPRIEAIADSGRNSHLNNIELWFAVQLRAHDECCGYSQEIAHYPTRGSRFRDRERKLMRPNSRKYELLPGTDIYDPIKKELLDSWVPGS